MQMDDFGLTVETSSARGALPLTEGSKVPNVNCSRELAQLREIAASSKKYFNFGALHFTGVILGRGACGLVELATLSNSVVPTPYAVKTIFVGDVATERGMTSMLREVVGFLRDIKCAYIVEYHEFDFDPLLMRASIAMDYMDLGSLQAVLQSTCPVPPTILKVIAQQVLYGLRYLHETMHCVHRDVKPSNLLLANDGRVKLTDLGLTREQNESTSTQTFAGTLFYMPPEAFSVRGVTTSKGDIWALGLTLCELAMGRHPLSEKARSLSGESASFWEVQRLLVATSDELLLKMFLPPEEAEYPMDSEMLSFFSCMLAREHHRRSTAAELLCHPWLTKACYLDSNGTCTVRTPLQAATLRAYTSWVAEVAVVRRNIQQ